MFVIPTTFKDTKALTHTQAAKNVKEGFVFYEPVKGESIEVTTWLRYATYDFIFGRPMGKRAEKEVACMWVRYEGGKHFCVYLDKQELKETIEALTKIKNVRTT